jgi:hypothetical protein
MVNIHAIFFYILAKFVDVFVENQIGVVFIKMLKLIYRVVNVVMVPVQRVEDVLTILEVIMLLDITRNILKRSVILL